MIYKVYRERRIPDGTISFSCIVAWDDNTHSHEEVAIPEDQAKNDVDLQKDIRKVLQDRKKDRPDKRIPKHIKDERRKEYEAW
mgnify:CR=1 FL=1